MFIGLESLGVKVGKGGGPWFEGGRTFLLPLVIALLIWFKWHWPALKILKADSDANKSR